MNQENEQASVERLRDLIQRHRVCYEVWPDYLMAGEKKVQVGFELQLSGTHEHPDRSTLPGCQRCEQVYEDLREIAEWIMPREERASRYEIQPFDRSLHQTPKRRFRPEVALTMKIMHRHGFDQPVDKCEEMCLKEMRRKLADLGVLEGRSGANG